MSHDHEFVSGPYVCGILVPSTKGALGIREDIAGPKLETKLKEEGYIIRYRQVVSDNQTDIANKLSEWVDGGGIDLILTTGGTGLSPSDVTPEATREVIDREVPGLAEAIRAKGRSKTPHADLSRGMAGIRKQCLIVNLPGSLKGAMEGLEVILPALPHAIDKIKGDPRDCGG